MIHVHRGDTCDPTHVDACIRSGGRRSARLGTHHDVSGCSFEATNSLETRTSKEVHRIDYSGDKVLQIIMNK